MPGGLLFYTSLIFIYSWHCRNITFTLISLCIPYKRGTKKDEGRSPGNIVSIGIVEGSFVKPDDCANCSGS